MRGHSFVLLGVILGFIVAPLPVSGQDPAGKPSGDSPRWYNPARYNPLKLIKRNPGSASDRLAADGNLEIKLSNQLRAQGVLPPDKHLLDLCTTFKELGECLAVLHTSHTLVVDFNCLKWDVTGVKPKSVPDACAGPAGGKSMSLYKAIDLLKPDADARTEARNAMKLANNDIRDASA